MNRVMYNYYYYSDDDNNNNFRTVVVSSSPDGSSRDVRGSVGCIDMTSKRRRRRKESWVSTENIIG